MVPLLLEIPPFWKEGGREETPCFLLLLVLLVFLFLCLFVVVVLGGLEQTLCIFSNGYEQRFIHFSTLLVQTIQKLVIM